MTTRGTEAGLAQRVADLEETVRNLLRLPGAVSPQALTGKADADHNHDGTYAPVSGGALYAETAVTLVAGRVIATVSGQSNSVEWEVSYGVGGNPSVQGEGVTITPFFGGANLTVPPGLYSVMLRVSPDTDLVSSDTWALHARFNGSNSTLYVYRPGPTSPYSASAEGQASAVMHVDEFGDDQFRAELYYDVSAEVEFSAIAYFIRLGNALPGVYTGFGP